MSGGVKLPMGMATREETAKYFLYAYRNRTKELYIMIYDTLVHIDLESIPTYNWKRIKQYIHTSWDSIQ